MQRLIHQTLAALAFAACIGLPFVLYFALVMKS